MALRLGRADVCRYVSWMRNWYQLQKPHYKIQPQKQMKLITTIIAPLFPIPAYPLRSLGEDSTNGFNLNLAGDGSP
jgi:hypothetical protein